MVVQRQKVVQRAAQQRPKQLPPRQLQLIRAQPQPPRPIPVQRQLLARTRVPQRRPQKAPSKVIKQAARRHSCCLARFLVAAFRLSECGLLVCARPGGFDEAVGVLAGRAQGCERFRPGYSAGRGLGESEPCRWQKRGVPAPAALDRRESAPHSHSVGLTPAYVRAMPLAFSFRMRSGASDKKTAIGNPYVLPACLQVI